MKSTWFIAAAATLACCVGCVSENNELGGNLIPANHIYKVVTTDAMEVPVSMKMSDSLSAYSSTRITIGAIRNDEEFGLSTRSSCVTLVPMFIDELDFGTNPVFRQFHFSAIADSISVCDLNQSNTLQSVFVHELSEPLDSDYLTYCKTQPAHGSELITTNVPVIGPGDSLSFNFTKAFGEKYLGITADDLKDIKSYTKRFPGIHITTNEPVGRGGRFNIFQLQLQYDSDYGYLAGSYAELKFKSTWNIDGEDVTKDSSFFFYFSPTDFYDLDSLFNKSGTGSFPQYCANVTGDASASFVGDAGDYIYVDGGGGVKPCFSAKVLRQKAIDAIAANGHDPKKAIINKASLTMHYLPSDENFEQMHKVPQILNPTCRIKTSDTTFTYMGLTDASDSNEDQGDIHRAQMTYSPDITYHLQTLLGLDDDNAQLAAGSYDIWMLIQHNDVITTTTSGNAEASEYYNYLAYQSMMGNMYGGYGYGGYGYGSYYSNYYNYAMMAQMYGSSSTSSKTQANLDRDRYYYCKLYGPTAADPELRPKFSFTYSIPNE
ncbi:MAG: DUF4270 domain-containing protein [Bacteroidales bacterium]|nr:DUF4270 domain-containing protein [Bacteroidales bacterium]